MSRRPDHVYVFEGGPLDGGKILAAPRTAIYRDADGGQLPVSAGSRRAGAVLSVARPRFRGGLYVCTARPMLAPRDGYLTYRPGRYRWMSR